MCQAEKTDIQPGGNGMEYQLVSFLIGGGASGTEIKTISQGHTAIQGRALLLFRSLNPTSHITLFNHLKFIKNVFFIR